MPDVAVLEVLLYGEQIGTLTLVQGTRTLFAFNKGYINNPERPTLSLSFKDQPGIRSRHARHRAPRTTIPPATPPGASQ